MPVGLPPRGGPLGRTRGRLSASALTTYLRCKRQWLLGYQAGLRGPVRPSQILGIVLEDAVCELFMMHPPKVDSHDALEDWAKEQIPDIAKQAYEKGLEDWNATLWKDDENSWDSVEVASLCERLEGGLNLMLEEVRACFEAGGGPYLESMRRGEQPFAVPSPSASSIPSFPLPDKVRDVEMREWATNVQPNWMITGSPVAWNEAWELARPWFKDPRVHQPQRLYHPDGWASGELDLVLRWDGKIRIVDIKSGRPNSAFSSSLEHQLRFYSWLWNQTHDQQLVDGMEGWYLNGGERIGYSPPKEDEIGPLTQFYREAHTEMQTMAEGVLSFPALNGEGCDGTSAGCYWCSVGLDDQARPMVADESLAWFADIEIPPLRAPFTALGDVQGRVSVRGKLTGAWGPMPNHFGEHVLGAVLVVGNQHITLEESEPGAFLHLHEFNGQDVVILNALPGVWRDQPRLYLDPESSVQAGDATDHDGITFTRLGLLRTRTNVRGNVLSIARRSGTRVDGKPWSMVSLILWDGSHIAEVVAFGASINQRLLQLRPGHPLGMTGAELGWRGGILQLRIDNRKTRLEFPSNVPQAN